MSDDDTVPWRYDEWRIYDAHWRTIAHAGSDRHRDWKDDARLIAAAPELLALLKRYVDTTPNMMLPDAEAAALIKRIEGGG